METALCKLFLDSQSHCQCQPDSEDGGMGMSYKMVFMTLKKVFIICLILSTKENNGAGIA
jgi:hypothetical protein